MIRSTKSLVILFAFVLCYSSFAQTNVGSLSGKVADEERSPLPGVNVKIIGTKLGSSTNIDGTFEIKNVGPGNYSVEFSSVGFQSFVKKNVRITAGRKELISVVLQQKDVELKAIDIVRDAFRQSKEDPRTSLQRMDPREAKVLPGAAEDVFRSLRALPGVLSPNDFSSQLIIRGSGPDQNLVVMDEVEVFNPYRLYGAVSMFNPETVTDINLMTGGYPAKYGNRLSAVLDVTNREGMRDNLLHGNLNTSLTNANIVLEGAAPFGVNGSWLLSSRRTYYDLIMGPIARNTGLVSSDVAFPNFGDIQSKIVFGPFDGHKIFINGVTSRDGVNIISGSNRETPDSVAVANTTINNIISTGWYYTPSNNVLNKFVLSWYDNHGTSEFDGKFLDPVLNRDDYSGPQTDSLKALARLFGISVNSSFKVQKYSAKDEISYQAENHLFESGVGFDYIKTDLFFELNLSPELKQIIQQNPRGSALVQSVIESQRYSKSFAYFQDKMKIGESVYFQPGLRFDYFDILGKAYFSPRINASFAIDALTTVRGAWGVYYQPPGYEKLFDTNQFFDLSKDNLKDVRAERALHYIVGIDRWLTSEWMAKSEIYFKRFDDLIVQKKGLGTTWTTEPIHGADPTKPSGWTVPYQVISDSLTPIPVNGSYGEAYGFEITIEKRNVEKSNIISGWVSYSLAWAQRYRDGYIIPFNYDQRHTLNVVSNYRPLDWLEIGAFWRIGSNFPYTAPVGVKPRIINATDGPHVATDFNGNVIFDLEYGNESGINQERKPWYHRLDMRCTAYTKFWGLSWGFYLDVINVYNQKNVNQYQYTIRKDGSLERKAINMFPLLPTIGINARF